MYWDKGMPLKHFLAQVVLLSGLFGVWFDLFLLIGCVLWWREVIGPGLLVLTMSIPLLFMMAGALFGLMSYPLIRKGLQIEAKTHDEEHVVHDS